MSDMSPDPPRRRRVPLALLLAVLVMVGATVAATWTGYRLHDEPFQRFNQNRVAATADRLWQTRGGVGVVALGSSALRHATLDETPMAALGARHGIASMQFLRIVNDAAEFADFEPMLQDILRMKPALVLLDLDLAFVERRDLYFYPAYLGLLGDAVEGSRPYWRDQIELQYAKPCARRDDPAWEASADPDRYVKELRAMLDLRVDSPSFERVRSFVEAARTAGIRVALLHLPTSTAAADRLFGPDNTHLPLALESAEEIMRVPVWTYPRPLDDRRDFCDFAHLAPEAREAYSDWLAGQIAEALDQPAMEEVSALSK